MIFSKLCEIAENRGMGSYDILLNLFGIGKTKKKDTESKIKLINKAIEDKLAVEILYSSITSGMNLRKVNPDKVLGSGKNSILVGFCHLRKAERLFQMDRIIDLQLSAK
jgi:predicted DNA-binding transcriptional regulator YafY